ncbi:MAG TPA: hypothetical protein VFA20_10215 [Myxococcaceae bacterium]|nr:hypothetical protein [Myxococcaceae bacterium]
MASSTRSRTVARVPAFLSSLKLNDTRWWHALDPSLVLAPGTPAPQTLRVPVRSAIVLLRDASRTVANLPKDSPATVVWTQGDSELLVRLDGLSLSCAPGVVSVKVPVRCDQLSKDEAMSVIFGVGTTDRTTGLVMSTYAHAGGPDVVASVWSDALSAFGWECLLHLAQQLSASVGEDREGKKLVPGAIGAERDLLLVRPMARHDLSWSAT